MSFRAVDPSTGEELEPVFPRATADDIETCVAAAAAVAPALAAADPVAIAGFLDDWARRIDADALHLAGIAHRETGLPVEPRLVKVEIPRTTGQLRMAAEAARTASWTQPTIDTKAGIRSAFEPIGKPVLVFGPNNFPFAFNAVAGGDCAAALAARSPVIAKAHPGHPATTRALFDHGRAALVASSLPGATLQVLYDVAPEVGLRLAGDGRLGAIGFTGSRAGGLALKAAADAAGIPIYLEMSSVNPVFILPGAITERGAAIADELTASCQLGGGQFCTNPGLVVVIDGPATKEWVASVAQRYAKAPPAQLLGRGVLENLEKGLAGLTAAGATLVAGGGRPDGKGFRFQPTLLTASGRAFGAAPDALQREAFGPATLVVVAEDAAGALAVAAALEGNLTATIYSAGDGRDEALYRDVVGLLRPKVGRLLDDKMPTGVAVSPAMMHGGPFPATGHPGFTSVGIPASIRRFAALRAYDHVRDEHLPPTLRDANPARIWRSIDGRWTQD